MIFFRAAWAVETLAPLAVSQTRNGASSSAAAPQRPSLLNSTKPRGRSDCQRVNSWPRSASQTWMPSSLSAVEQALPSLLKDVLDLGVVPQDHGPGPRHSARAADQAIIAALWPKRPSGTESNPLASAT